MARTTTLLNLVIAVQDVARTDAEVVATIVHLVNSGAVRLGGTFAGARFEAAAADAPHAAVA